MACTDAYRRSASTAKAPHKSHFTCSHAWLTWHPHSNIPASVDAWPATVTGHTGLHALVAGPGGIQRGRASALPQRRRRRTAGRTARARGRRARRALRRPGRPQHRRRRHGAAVGVTRAGGAAAAGQPWAALYSWGLAYAKAFSDLAQAAWCVCGHDAGGLPGKSGQHSAAQHMGCTGMVRLGAWCRRCVLIGAAGQDCGCPAECTELQALSARNAGCPCEAPEC